MFSLPSLFQNLQRRKTHPLTLSAATGAAGVAAHGDDLGLVGDVAEEGESALQLHAVDGLGGLAGVLEADTQVRAPGAGALSGRNLLSSVTDLKNDKSQISIKCPQYPLFSNAIDRLSRW